MMSKGWEYTIVVFLLSMVASLMYGAYYAALLTESQSPVYYDDGCGGLIFRPSVVL